MSSTDARAGTQPLQPQYLQMSNGKVPTPHDIYVTGFCGGQITKLDREWRRWEVGTCWPPSPQREHLQQPCECDFAHVRHQIFYCCSLLLWAEKMHCIPFFGKSTFFMGLWAESYFPQWSGTESWAHSQYDTIKCTLACHTHTRIYRGERMDTSIYLCMTISVGAPRIFCQCLYYYLQ